MDFLGTIAQVLGDAVNGVLQVVADFLNLVISIVPNPDPFPEIIEGMSADTGADMGFAVYWLNNAVDVNAVSALIAAWAGLMVASCVFAVIYWVVKSIKP